MRTERAIDHILKVKMMASVFYEVSIHLLFEVSVFMKSVLTLAYNLDAVTLNHIITVFTEQIISSLQGKMVRSCKIQEFFFVKILHFLLEINFKR